MRRINRTVISVMVLVLGLGVALLPGVGSAAGQGSCTVQVLSGQSIQAAIDAASPGATVCVGRDFPPRFVSVQAQAMMGGGERPFR